MVWIRKKVNKMFLFLTWEAQLLISQLWKSKIKCMKLLLNIKKHLVAMILTKEFWTISFRQSLSNKVISLGEFYNWRLKSVPNRGKYFPFCGLILGGKFFKNPVLGKNFACAKQPLNLFPPNFVQNVGENFPKIYSPSTKRLKYIK